MVTFAFDKFALGKPVPNLACWSAEPYTPEWALFSIKWPYTEPMHFLDYLNDENIEHKLTTVENADHTCAYPISVSFFDFNVNWRQLIPKKVIESNMLIWFFYSEGDNPYKIKQHLDQQLAGCNYHFTSANTKAQDLEKFSYFADDELLSRMRNKNSIATTFHSRPRSKQFTALSRTHKLWRATTMARLWNQNLHKLGYFSYNNAVDLQEHYQHNPISTKRFREFPIALIKFLNACPFTADNLNSNEHNNHSVTVAEHFFNSYLNIVLETHMDTDGSGGAFLTEKIFKPIKHCQLFVCIGAPGTIKKLQDMGYCTFDHVIDHSYDSEPDNTRRWDMAMQETERLIQSSQLHNIYEDAKQDLLHNQNLFLSSKLDRLNILLEKLEKA
jgi:hypothetical protein